MTIKTAATALGTALLIAGAPAIGSASTGEPSPIHLESVQITPQNDNGGRGIQRGQVSVAFANQGSAPVTDVVFGVESHGGVVNRIDDRGSFKPGVSVKHNFSDDLRGNHLQLAVLRVTFADGTAWTRSGLPLNELPQGLRDDAPVASQIDQ
jgi:hypothetical protein